MAAIVDDRVVEYFLVVTASVVIVTTSGLIASMLVRGNAAMRHCFLLAALLCSLASPVITGIFIGAGTSVFEVPFLSPNRAFPSVVAVHQGVGSHSGGVTPPDSSVHPLRSSLDVRKARAVGMPGVQRSWPQISVPQACVLIWAFVAGCLFLGALRSVLKLQRLRHTCRPATESHLHAAMLEAIARLQIKSAPPAMVSPRVRVPLVMGPFHPVIVLPEGCHSVMSQVALSDVLVHEMAHVLRHDHLIVLLESVARALFWPIPSVHLLNRSLGVAREELCDNYVLRDRDAVSYGETLLRLGEFAHGGTLFNGSVGALHWHGALEDRVSHLLEKGRNTMTQVNRAAGFVLFVVCALGTVAVCGTRIVAAAGEKSQAEARPSNLARTAEEADDTGPDILTPVIGDNYFVAPVTTELQRRLLGTISGEMVLQPADDLLAYACVNAYSLFDRPHFRLSDPTGEDFVPIRRSVRKFAPSTKEGRLRVVIDYGHMRVDTGVRQLVQDAFRGMAHDSGYSKVQVHGRAYNPIDNESTYDWPNLSASVDERPQDEDSVEAGPALISPVTTALSRYLTKDADCYIEVPGPLSLEEKAIFSVDDIPLVRRALSNLRIGSRKRVLLRARLEAIEDPRQVLAEAPARQSPMPQLRQGSEFHSSAVRLLKENGFQTIQVDVVTSEGTFGGYTY